MTELESGFRLADLTALGRRRSAIFLGAAILGLVAGYLAFASAPPSYSATTRVQVQPLTTDPFAPGGTAAVTLEVATEQDLVESDAVGDRVREQLGLDGDNRELFQSLAVTSGEDSLVLELTAESSSAGQARDVANAVAEAYLNERQGNAEEIRTENVERINQQRTEALDALTEANQAVEATEEGTAAQAEAQAASQEAQQLLAELNARRSSYVNLDTSAVGQVIRRAPMPSAVLSPVALARGVGVFGVFAIAGLGVAMLVDRRDSLGGGRRQVERLAPNAGIRILPTASGDKAGPAEVDAAIDRLAIDLASKGSRGRAASVLVVGTGMEPPLALAEELASSLTFAGIPALFVLAGTSEREPRHVHVVASFTDLIAGPSVTGPASLPEVAGATGDSPLPTVTWLRPRGSAESSGLLRRAVVEALITRAGREGFEAVVFVAASPTRNAAAAALGQWAGQTAVIVEDDDGHAVEQTVDALIQAGVEIGEVVWA